MIWTGLDWEPEIRGGREEEGRRQRRRKEEEMKEEEERLVILSEMEVWGCGLVSVGEWLRGTHFLSADRACHMTSSH